MVERQSGNVAMSEKSVSWRDVFYRLLEAETESEVTQVLRDYQLLDESLWIPYDNNENNFAQASNQQADPAAALTEKITNAIDAVLMRRAHECGVDPESRDAPQSMQQAVERFFDIPTGQLRYFGCQRAYKAGRKHPVDCNWIKAQTKLSRHRSGRRPDAIKVSRHVPLDREIEQTSNTFCARQVQLRGTWRIAILWGSQLPVDMFPEAPKWTKHSSERIR